MRNAGSRCREDSGGPRRQRRGSLSRSQQRWVPLGRLCNPGRGGAVGVPAVLAYVSQPRAAPRVQWKPGLEWKVKKQQPSGRVGRGSPSPWQRHRAMEAAAGQRQGPAASVPAARPDPRAQPPARSGRRREGPGQPLASPESGKEMQVQRGWVRAGAALRGRLAVANKHTENAERKRGRAVAERPGTGAPLSAEPVWSGRPAGCLGDAAPTSDGDPAGEIRVQGRLCEWKELTSVWSLRGKNAVLERFLFGNFFSP